MKYSIIIPTYNKFDEALKPCIESIYKYSLLFDTEIIVVANGCTDETGDFMRILSESQPDRVKLVWFDEAIGYTKSINEGLKVATGEFIVLLNNDTILLDQTMNRWLEILNEPFTRDPMTGITGPMMTHCPSADRMFLIFFCVMINRKVFDHIGNLDEIFSPGYGEDSDFCFRAEDAGFKLIQVPQFSDRYYADKRMTGDFPIYHEGNVTFKNWPGGEELLKHNNEVLRSRYNKTQNITIDRAMTCDGFMSNEELTWLAQQATKHKIIIEVGSWHGKSTRALGDNAAGIVYAVDHWNGSAGEDQHHGSARWMNGDHAYFEFLQNNMDLVQEGKIIPIRMHSTSAAEFFKDQNIKADMIFIDAGHTYDEVTEDIKKWLPILKSDGLICGHDYYHDGYSWVGVKNAVDQYFGHNTVKLANQTSIWNVSLRDHPINEPKVFDCFPFFNELDVLEIRFNELYDVVDRFVIVEATKTHGGQDKPLYFKDNLQRFERFLHKVTHIILDDYPAMDPWSIERHQRDRLSYGLNSCKDNDIIIISDVDEIPRAETIREYKLNHQNMVCGVEQDLYYYNLNCRSTFKWNWLRILPFNIFKNITPCQARYMIITDEQFIIKDGGWHLSYMGGIDQIIDKIQATAHQEYNLPEIRERDRIIDRVNACQDIFDRGLDYERVEVDSSYPHYVQQNIDLFKQKQFIVQ